MGNLEFRYFDTLPKYKERMHNGKRFNSDYGININTIRRCAIVVGRNPWVAKDPLEVLKWRLSLITSFIEVIPSGEICIKNINYLETTEKSSVGYMLGMIFTQIFAQELLGIRQLLHLTGEEVNVTTVGKSPDLCGFNKSKNRAYLLEAKGSTILSNKMDNDTVKTACTQLDSVSQIEFTRIEGKFRGNSLTKYIIATHPNINGEFEQEIIDPDEEETCSITVDCDLMILKHYYNVYAILKKFKEEQFVKDEFIFVKIKSHGFNIGMLKKIFEYLDPIYEEASPNIFRKVGNLKIRNYNDIYTKVNKNLDEWQQRNKQLFNKYNLNLLDKKMDGTNIREDDCTKREKMSDIKINDDHEDDKNIEKNSSVGLDGICVY